MGVVSPSFSFVSRTTLLVILTVLLAQRFTVVGASARLMTENEGKESAEIVTPIIAGDVGHGNDKPNHRNSHQSHSLVLTLKLKKTTIRLRLRQDNVAFAVRTEWIGENHTSSSEVNRKCLFEGTLDGATEPTATISICNGVTGTIGTPNGDIYIRPVASEVRTISSPHRVWKLRGGEIANLGNDENLSGWSDRGADDRETESGRRRHRRSTGHLGIRYIHVMVVTDQTVVRFHGREIIEEYILTQMNIVNNIYHHPSLGVELNIVVAKITVLDDRTTDLIVRENDGMGTLGRFCSWTGRERLSYHGSEQFDVAIYLTRKELGSAGFAPVTGMCMPTRSCALIKDDGISSAFVISHEMAHVMGLSHDGLENNCDEDPSDGKIMSAMVQSSYNKYYWTRCSRERLAQVLPGLTCLNDKPKEPHWPEIEQPFGKSWSISEQCRQEFGVGFGACDAFKEMDPCKQLWCSEAGSPLLCQTKKGPALPGTTCAEGKWCMDGECRPIGRVAVDGAWAAWMEWGPCSRSCGTGVQYRIRTCSDPRPAHGGKECSGKNEGYQLCSKQSCPHPTDYRAEQCKEHNVKTFTRMRRHHWLPVENIDEARKCKLTCISQETEDLLESEDNVVDGTHCSYTTPHNICIRGKCHKLGCDKMENSYAEEDRCGVCGGRGDSCKVMSGTYTKKLPKREYHLLLTLPAETRNIVVKERYFANHLAHFIAVRDKTTKEIILNGNERVGSSKRFIVHGTRFVYIKKGRGESLTARGPLMAPLEILIYSLSSTLATSLYYEYTIPRYLENSLDAQPIHRVEKPKYVWRYRGWGPCTKTCGGGVRHKVIVCINAMSKQIVDSGLCTLFTRPDNVTRPCHKRRCDNHPYRWKAHKWGACSTTCGIYGYQTRRVYCLQMNRYGNNMHWKVNAVNCNTRRMPKRQRACNRKACPGEWTTTAWSKCSVSCGVGLQKRRVYCQKRKDGNRYRCPSKHPNIVRYCTMSQCEVRKTTTTSTTTPTTTPVPTTTTTTTTVPTTLVSPTTQRRRPTFGVRARMYVSQDDVSQTNNYEYNPYVTPVPSAPGRHPYRHHNRIAKPAPRRKSRLRPAVVATSIPTRRNPTLRHKQHSYVTRVPRTPLPDAVDMWSRNRQRSYTMTPHPVPRATRRLNRERTYPTAIPVPVISPVQRYDTRRPYVTPTPPRTVVPRRSARMHATPLPPIVTRTSTYVTVTSYTSRWRGKPPAKTDGKLCRGDKSVFCQLGANSAHCRLRPYWDMCCYSCSRFLNQA